MKKGFTLIEIIICIALITIIGTASFFGVRLVNKQIKISKLEQITDKAIQAAQVYIETNKGAYNQLYNNHNGVSLPLKLLYNEGLLSLENTDLNIGDLEDEYVVTFLGGSGGTEKCEQITSSASWANDKPIYLCMKSDGSSNLATIDLRDYGNRATVLDEPYYFRGKFVDSYLKYNGKTYRILKINRDDSMVLYSNSQIITGEFSKIIGSIRNVGEQDICDSIEGCSSYYSVDSKSYYYINNEWKYLSADYWNPDNENDYRLYTILPYESSGTSSIVHIDSCYKINSGIGTNYNPYILDDSKC